MGRNAGQHQGSGNQQPVLLYPRVHRGAQCITGSAGYRLVPCLHDIPQDWSLFPVFSHHHPIRTGIVRDIRNQLYQKITSLSLGFFSEERKGDIIARMSGDVQEVENSIMSSLDMLFKNPILILFYFITLICISCSSPSSPFSLCHHSAGSWVLWERN